MMGRKKRLVHVTREDIARGIPRTEASCPVALALRRSTGSAHVKVSNSSIRVGNSPAVRAPGSVSRFIYAFDSILTRPRFVAPFSFWFPSPPPRNFGRRPRR